MNTTVNTYAEAIQYLAIAARLGVQVGGMTADAAADLAATNAKQTAFDARTRNGIWASTTSAAQIEDALFMGTVASDVLDGTVRRPSVGNVRQALIATVTR